MLMFVMLLRFCEKDDMGFKNSIVSTFSTLASWSESIPTVCATSIEKINCSANFLLECSILTILPFILSKSNSDCVHKGPQSLT